MGSSDRQTVDLEALKGFKRRVDDILTGLGDSGAAPHSIGEDRLVSDHLGKNFNAVTSLFGAYHDIQTDLEELSRLLTAQIEALGTAIHGAHNSYVDTDLAQRDRMWQVQAELQRHNGQAPEPHQPAARPGDDKGAM